VRVTAPLSALKIDTISTSRCTAEFGAATTTTGFALSRTPWLLPGTFIPAAT
jgi:hypothetical protein